MLRMRFRMPSLRPAYCLFAVALAARLWAIARLTHSSLLRPTGGDMRFYDEWAQRIVDGQISTGSAFYAQPLYAYWLAALYHVFGAAPLAPLLLQACADAATATVLCTLATHIFQDSPHRLTIGLIAACAWILYVPAEAYSAVLLPTELAVCLFWLVVSLAIRRRNHRTVLLYAALGCLLGFAGMAVASVLFLAPVIAGIAFTSQKPASVSTATTARRVVILTALILGIAAGTAPAWIYNRFVAREPVFLSAHGGVNLWLGNNPEATGYPHFPGLRTGQAEMLHDSIALAETAAGRPLKRSEAGAFWSAKARNYVLSRPFEWLRLLGRKFWNFWNAFEYDDVGVIDALRRARVILPGPHFALVAAFAVPGCFFALRRSPRSLWIAVAVASQMVAVMTVFVTERYRTLAVPGLLLFGAFALVLIFEAIANRNAWKAFGLSLPVVWATILIATPPQDPALWALICYNEGRQALTDNDVATAEQKLKRALDYVPDSPETLVALGNARLAASEPAKAKEYYQRALELVPENSRALNNLGVIALEENDASAAVQLFRRAILQAPGNAKLHYLLARALVASGERAAALAEIRAAVQLAPSQPEFQKFLLELEGNQ